MDNLISKSKDVGLWSASYPIGSESMRILKLVQGTARCLYDLQNLHFKDTNNLDEYEFSRKRAASQRNTSDMPFYELIEIKFKNISNIKILIIFFVCYRHL